MLLATNPIFIDQLKCTGCSLCVKDCPAGYLRLVECKATTREDGCIECGHCYSICPSNAIMMNNYEFTEERVASMSEFDSTTMLCAMKSRRSVRQFKSQPVEQEKLERILEAGRYAPTATNAQDVSYIILGARQQEIERECVYIFRRWKKFLAPFVKFIRNIEVTDDFFFKGAPLVIVIKGKIPLNNGLASSYMEIMAESQELGALYSGFFIICARFSKKIRKALELQKGEKVTACLVIGYPSVKYQRIPPRKKLSVKIL